MRISTNDEVNCSKLKLCLWWDYEVYGKIGSIRCEYDIQFIFVHDPLARRSCMFGGVRCQEVELCSSARHIEGVHQMGMALFNAAGISQTDCDSWDQTGSNLTSAGSSDQSEKSIVHQLSADQYI
jgi:hypothetical protein